MWRSSFKISMKYTHKADALENDQKDHRCYGFPNMAMLSNNWLGMFQNWNKQEKL